MSVDKNNKWEELASKSIEAGVDEHHSLETQAKETKDSEEKSSKAEADLGDKQAQSHENKMQDLEAKVKQEQDKVLELMAELANVRRRAARDLENAHKYGVEKLLKELLPVIDSLEQALATEQTISGEGASAMKEGTELTLSLFLSALEKFSLTPINPEGTVFDPLQHEAMSMQPNSDVPANTVLFVVQKGYLLHGRVIRPARVVVSKSVEKS